MVKQPPTLVGDLRGASQLTVEATKGVTALVESMHRSIAAGPDVLGRPLEGLAARATQAVYGRIRRVTGMVGAGIDVALARLEPLLAVSTSATERDAVLAVLCGVLGDYLEATDNPLAQPMQLRRAGRPLDGQRLEGATGRLLVMVHGSCMTDARWRRDGHEHGDALARDAGWTRIGVQYNSGLHISINGEHLASALQDLVERWPVPLREIALVGHSMGGLVCRSACWAAEQASLGWRQSLGAVVTLGAPHHGAPLERGGNWVDVLLGVSRYSAPLAQLGKIRSAGVTDLRYGSVIPEHWAGRDRFAPGGDPRVGVPLPEGVRCCAVAATRACSRSDGLVPVDSALGTHRDPSLALAFDERFVLEDAGHLDLLGRPEVYAKLRAWLGAP